MSRKQERLYGVWSGMKSRVSNPNNKAFYRYGGRGITLCGEWADSYEAFKSWALANGYREGLTIDRIDNDGGYCPENCRWTDRTVQANNKSDNHLITYNGQTKTSTQWGRETGLNSQIITGRLKLGWSVEDALQTKKQRNKIGYRYITYNGKTLTLSQWARETGINKRTLSYRIDNLNWTVERALTTPVRH